MTPLTFVPLDELDQSARPARAAAAAPPPIIFGREAVLVGEAGPAAAAPPAATRRTLGRDKVLAAVVQKGRLFQQSHPAVPVLRDRGRFLLVELDADDPLLTASPAEPCFAAYRLQPGDEVFRDLDPTIVRARRDPEIGTIVDGLSLPTFRAALEELVRLHTRLSTSSLFREAAGLCRARLEAMGYSVTLQDFSMPGGSSCNVLVTGGPGEAAALVMGHLDSVNHAGGSEAIAPGADDNASGSAGVIAMAEALLPLRDRLKIAFALFGGEEQGLLGSKHLLAGMPPEARAALKAIINMDMIGTLNRLPDGTTVPPGVLLEGAEVSRGVVDGLAQQAASWTQLAVQVSFNPYASDHVPFIQAGLPAVLTIEGADQANDKIHGPDDTLDRINDGLALQILRMNTGYIASLARA